MNRILISMSALDKLAGLAAILLLVATASLVAAVAYFLYAYTSRLFVKATEQPHKHRVENLDKMLEMQKVTHRAAESHGQATLIDQTPPATGGTP